MKKKIILVTMALIGILVLTGCSVGNRSIGIDTTQTFDKFILSIGDKTIEGSVKSWRDFDDGDEVQFTTPSGETYLTYYANVVLIKSK